MNRKLRQLQRQAGVAAKVHGILAFAAGLRFAGKHWPEITDQIRLAFVIEEPLSPDQLEEDVTRWAGEYVAVPLPEVSRLVLS